MVPAGLCRPRSRTPVAHARMLEAAPSQPALQLVSQDLQWLATRLEDRIYGENALSEADAQQARTASDRVVKALAKIK